MSSWALKAPDGLSDLSFVLAGALATSSCEDTLISMCFSLENHMLGFQVRGTKVLVLSSHL